MKTENTRSEPDFTRESLIPKLRKAKRVVIKIGTSLLTDSSDKNGIHYERIRTLANGVEYLLGHGIYPMLVSSGSVGMGRFALKKLKSFTPNHNPTIARKQALASIGQSRLMSAYNDIFEKKNFVVSQILITARDLRDRRSYLNIGHTLEELVKLGCIPIVNENDTVATDELRELKYGDNDLLAAACASLFRADVLIILTSVEGFIVNGKKLDLVTDITKELYSYAGGPVGPGIGGMQTKLDAAKRCMLSGDFAAILPGYEDYPIRRLLGGENIGTLFYSRSKKKLSARKRWILYARADGSVRVDDGAKKALLENGSSLLPAGITQICGRFFAGDIIEIRDSENSVIGRGISNYTYRDILPLIGKNKEERKQTAGFDREIVHRNNFIIEP